MRSLQEQRNAPSSPGVMEQRWGVSLPSCEMTMTDKNQHRVLSFAYRQFCLANDRLNLAV